MSYCRLLTIVLSLALAGCSTIQSILILSPPAQTPRPPSCSPRRAYSNFNARADANGRYWKFITPQAELKDAKGHVVARQGSEGSVFAKDGSILVAKIEKYADDASPGNLRDLVYRTTSRGKEGMLTGITHIKRSNGKGGVPLTRCSPSQLGSTLKVPLPPRTPSIATIDKVLKKQRLLLSRPRDWTN